MKTEHTKDTNVISMDKQYTRNGKKVRVLCVDGNCKYFPVVVMDEDGGISLHTQEGRNELCNAGMFDLKEYNCWQGIAVDTKVYVKFWEDTECARHFSHYENGTVYVYTDGNTSFTTECTVGTSSARLA